MRRAYRVSCLMLLLPLAGCHDAGSGARPAAAQGAPDAGMTVELRRVWSGPEVSLLGRPSADGRWYSTTDWETGDLAVRDLVNGTTRRVTSAGWPDFAEFTAISPDGSRIAYAWFTDGAYELRVINVDGTGVRTMYRNDAEMIWTWPHGWSQDGRTVLATLSFAWASTDSTPATEDSRLAMIPADGGDPRWVRSFGRHVPEHAEISPDGQWIAFDLPTGDGPGTRDIHVMPASGGDATRITTDAVSEVLIGWAPSGDYIWYATEMEGAPARVSRIPVRGGRRAGDPELVRADLWEFGARGFTRNALVYGVDIEKPGRYEAVMDAGAGRMIREPVRVTRPLQAALEAAAWSPDGEVLAYAMRPQGLDLSGTRIILRSTSTGSEQELLTSLARANEIVWAPDGRALYLAAAMDGREGIFRLDLQSQQLERVPGTKDDASTPRVFVSSDGGTLYFRERGELPRVDSSPRIVAHDLATHQQRVLFEAAWVGGFAVSRDARWLAVVVLDEGAEIRSMLLVDLVRNSPPRTLMTRPMSFGYGSIQFSEDATRLRFTGRDDFQSQPVLYEMNLAGGEPRRLMEVPVRRIDVHPDGRRFTYVSGATRSELWVMEDLPGFPPRGN
jgi:Tol biopolymer transport system component